MKKNGLFYIVFALMLSMVSLFSSENISLKQDISKLLTNKKVKVDGIKIIASDKISDIKDLHIAIGTIKGSTKPFLLLYNKKVLIFGNMIDRKSGKSIFEEFIKKNREQIKKALYKENMEKKKSEIANYKKLISLLKTKYKDLVISIKGGNSKGKTVYLITDPNCPFCKEYEKKVLPKTIKSAKEVKIVPIYLNIQGHETSPLKSSWLILEAKKSRSEDILNLMHRASNPKDMGYKKVDKKEAKKMIKKMKELIGSGLIDGTPSVFDQDGNPMR